MTAFRVCGQELCPNWDGWACPCSVLDIDPPTECDGCGDTPAAPTCPHVQQCRACGPVLTGCWECKRDERSEG